MFRLSRDKLVTRDGMVEGRIVWHDTTCLILANANNLYISNDYGGSFHLAGTIPLSYVSRIKVMNPLGQRLFRFAVSSAVRLNEKVFFLYAFGKCYHWNAKTGAIDCISEPKHTSRPLSFAYDGKNLYYGEYRSNPERSCIALQHSVDGGITWSTYVRYFGIRHIHGVYYDPYDKVLWMTTEDYDDECGIWRSRGLVPEFEKVVGGSQQYRAIQLLFDKDYVYYGTDTPLEKNYICRINRKTKQVASLQAVGSSVFYGCKCGNDLFFSTVVEPSRVNTTKYVELWHSRNRTDWNIIRTWRKDLLSMKYFQYGQILFPNGSCVCGGALWCSPMSVYGGEKSYRFKFPAA